MAPKMPVLTAKMAVNVGDACTRSAMPIAIGAVTDLAMRPRTNDSSTPNQRAMPTAVNTEVMPPATSDSSNTPMRPLSEANPL